MKKQVIAAVVALPFVLGACSKSNEDGSDDGFEISIDLSDDEKGEADKVSIGNEDKPGKFSIKAEGFSMDVDMPEIKLDADDFDLNDVNLYPGTSITSFNVEDRDDKGGKVTLGFDAPADAGEVSQWYENKMTAEKFEVSRSGNNLSGTTDDGDPFSLKLVEKSAEKTSGTLEFSETK